MKYRLIIFDLDGTLLNTIGDLTDSVNYSMRFLQFPEHTEEEVLSFVGNGNRVLMERCLPGGTGTDTIDLALAKFHEYYSRHYADKTFPYEKVPELLTGLKASGYLMAVVSNKADYAVQDICKKYFDGIFDFVIGDREGIRRKPAPDPVNLAMQVLGATKEQTVYIGDSEVDIETAFNAAIPCISVDWGFRSHDQLVCAGARVIVSSPDDIPACIEGSSDIRPL